MPAADPHLRVSSLFLRRLLAAGGVALVLLLTVLAASPELDYSQAVSVGGVIAAGSDWRTLVAAG